MKYRTLLLMFCLCSCCCTKPPKGDNYASHCATDLPFNSQLSAGTTEGKDTLQQLASSAKYADTNRPDVWCNDTWNSNVVSIFCNHQVDEYCKKNCSTGESNTECTQEAARTKLTARCARDSIEAFRKILPDCKGLAICGLELKASCAAQ